MLFLCTSLVQIPNILFSVCHCPVGVEMLVGAFQAGATDVQYMRKLNT